MNFEQWKAFHRHVCEIQRLSLVYAEHGEMDVSRLLMAAAVKASKIKPTRPEGEGVAAKKGKGA